MGEKQSKSGEAVAQVVEWSSIPGSSDPHVEVSLGRILNPKLLPMCHQRVSRKLKCVEKHCVNG